MADDTSQAELRRINSELDKSGRMLRSLYENMVSGIITTEEYVRMKADYEAKIALYSDRADEIRDAGRKLENCTSEYRVIHEAAEAVISSQSLSAEIVDRLVDKILVNPDKGFEVHFRFGDEFKEVCA